MAAYFDATFYLEGNPDVAAAVDAGIFSDALDHFIRFGQFEQRDPDAAFDTSYYLAQNPDVAAAVSAGIVQSAFAHFVQYGQFEGAVRAPNAIFAAFDETAYLTANPDVAAAVQNGLIPNAFAHFLAFGQNEGREGSPSNEMPVQPPVGPIDTTPPAAPIITFAENAATSLAIGVTTTVVFTFSEVPFGFTASDVLVTGGSIGTLTRVGDTGRIYQATVTPNAGLEGALSITVPAKTFSDAAGNLNAAGSQPLEIPTDTQAPSEATLEFVSDFANAVGIVAVPYTLAGGEGGTTLVTLGGLDRTTGEARTIDVQASTKGTLDLSGFRDGSVTATIVTTDTAGNQTSGTGSVITVDTTADVGGDLAVIITPAVLNAAANLTSIKYAIEGLDSDATATVTFTGRDAQNEVITANGSNGTVDLTGFLDGTIQAAIKATDTAGNTATGAGATVLIDTTADVGGDLAVLITPSALNAAANRAAVEYTIKGLDSDATATVTFTGLNAQNQAITANGSNGTVNLTEFLDGTIQASIKATDIAGNTATGAGDTVLIDTTPPSIVEIILPTLGSDDRYPFAFKLVFSEDVSSGEGFIRISGGNSTLHFAPSIRNVTYDSNVVTFNSDILFRGSGDYVLRIDSGNITDHSGNGLTGIGVENSIYFNIA